MSAHLACLKLFPHLTIGEKPICLWLAVNSSLSLFMLVSVSILLILFVAPLRVEEFFLTQILQLNSLAANMMSEGNTKLQISKWFRIVQT